MRLLPVYLTAEEVHRLQQAATSDRDRLLIWLLWATGARVSEVVQARVGDVTETGIRLANLKRHGRHSLAEKHVVLPPPAVEYLKGQLKGRDPSEYIFPGRSGRGHLSRKMAWLIVKEAAARAGIFRRTPRRNGAETAAWPHTLRHSYAVHLLREGKPITLVQRQLGHRNLSATQVYTQLADVHVEELMREVAL